MTFNDFAQNIINQFEDPEKISFSQDTIYKEIDTWDSLTAMSIQTTISDDYGVEVSNDELRESNTLKDLFDIVKKKM